MLSMGVVGIDCQATLTASSAVVRPKLPHVFVNNNSFTFKPRRTTSSSSSSFISHSLPQLKLRRDFKLSAAAEALVAEETTSADVIPDEEHREAWSGCEADGEAKACIEVHLDGKEHRHCTRPNDSRPWFHPTQPVLLLAEERFLGGAQGLTREQAVDISKADDYSSQSGH